MSKDHSIPWTRDRRLMVAGADIANATRRTYPGSPEVAAARTNLRVLRVALAIEDLVSSAPAPTPEQISRLRALLPPVTPEAAP